MTPTATNDNGKTATSSSSTYLSKNPEIAQFSQFCQNNSGPNASPRAKEVIDSLMAHLHAWFEEVQVTPEEFLMGCDAMAKAGKMCDDKRNEFILLGDIMGLETLADTMAHDRARKQANKKVEGTNGTATTALPTSSAILGPFFRENAPKYSMGHDIVQDHSTLNHEGKQGEATYMFGTLTDVDGNPIEGATIDVWHDAINGLYEQQDPKQPEYNCRGKFTTGADGKYSYKCLKPVAYPIPYDSTSGDLLKLLDRSPMRPGHIHLFIRAQGFQPLITQIFDRSCPYLQNDSVFATKDDLVVDFVKASHPEAKGCVWELPYDIRLVKQV